MDARRHETGYKQTHRTQPAAELRPVMIRRHGRKQSADEALMLGVSKYIRHYERGMRDQDV